MDFTSGVVGVVVVFVNDRVNDRCDSLGYILRRCHSDDGRWMMVTLYYLVTAVMGTGHDTVRPPENLSKRLMCTYKSRKIF